MTHLSRPRDLSLATWDTRRWQLKDSVPLELPFVKAGTGRQSTDAGSTPHSPSKLLSPLASEPLSPSATKPGNCTALVLSPDGKVVASVHTNDLVCIWDVSNTVRLASKKGRLPVSFSPDGSVIATGFSNVEVQVWEVGTALSTYTYVHVVQLLFRVQFQGLSDPHTVTPGPVCRPRPSGTSQSSIASHLLKAAVPRLYSPLPHLSLWLSPAATVMQQRPLPPATSSSLT